MGSLTVWEQKGSLSQHPEQLYKEGTGLVGRPETWPGAFSPTEWGVCVCVCHGLFGRLGCTQNGRCMFLGPQWGEKEFPINQEQSMSSGFKRGKCRPKLGNSLTHFPSCQGFQRIMCGEKKRRRGREVLNMHFQVIPVNR